MRNKKVETNKKEKRDTSDFFLKKPIWKVVLQMMIPSIIMMLIFGTYTFVDNVLSINLANDSYQPFKTTRGIVDTKTLVRHFMAGITPVTTFIFAVIMLFGLGISRRYTVNIAAGKKVRAIQTIKTGNQISLLIAFLLIPILLFTSKLWIKAQFDRDPLVAELIAKEGYEYIWIIIISLPIQMFNQTISSLLRAEARNKQVMFAMIMPVFLNILMDYLFMGPLGLGIEGGAWATFISYVISGMLLLVFIIKDRKSLINLKNLFGFKEFKWVTLVGVVAIGAAPFMRNMAQSITQTFEMAQIQKVSLNVYHDPMAMTRIMTAVFPLFGLFFPIMFAGIQAGSPVASYNFGAKNMKRVKQTVIWVVIYSFALAVFLYVISTFLLFRPLNHLLGNENTPAFASLDKSNIAYGIMMVGLPLLSVFLGAMTLFSSTDRVLMGILASSLRGAVLLVPFLLGFAAIANANTGDANVNLTGNNGAFSSEYIFWWFYTAIIAATSIITVIMGWFTWRKLETNQKTFEEKLERFHEWTKRKFNKAK
ncbi:MAG: hypothetical protein KAG14_01995 [Mycoplasmataceae bacterium]|nr:hypothetical protein [Mycoplasmataceae bacterium]